MRLAPLFPRFIGRLFSASIRFGGEGKRIVFSIAERTMVTSAVPIGGRAQMIQRCRIGELLSGIVPLSNHDVEEILQEQSGTHRKFGEIALAWGLSQPEHVWNAWCRQLAQGFER